MFGRAVIYTDEPVITAENVVSVLQKAVSTHSKNANEINYLWEYYKGKTPILNKSKEVRPEINHKLTVARPVEIVRFKRGYVFGEPIQYVRRGTDESLTDDVAALNEYMFCANKHSEDSSLAEWLYVGGVGMRMALPGKDSDEPFKIYTLDPRHSFVIHYNGLGDPVVAGVKVVERENQVRVYSVYTPEWYFEIENDVLKTSKPHTLGMVPIFEYPANAARTGSFECCLSLIDALSEIESNRLDDVVQYVNSFLALLGGTIDDETAKKLDEFKMLCLPEGVDAKYLSVAMQQNDTQVLIDDLYSAILTICAIPFSNGSASTSDTGQAVYLRSGYTGAENDAQNTENEFKRSEREFLKLILRILRDTVGTKLTLKDLDIKFSRRNYDNLQTKSQVLTTMLTNPKIDPYLAFTHCGMFLDPESAYLMSKAWWESNEAKVEVEVEDAETDPMP